MLDKISADERIVVSITRQVSCPEKSANHGLDTRSVSYLKDWTRSGSPIYIRRELKLQSNVGACMCQIYQEIQEIELA